MASILSYIPILNRLVGPAGGWEKRIRLAPVQVHQIEVSRGERARTLKQLIKANHVNHAVIYHDLQFDNHAPHVLCSAYLLGATAGQLRAIYEAESRELEPWPPSPAEITPDDWRDFVADPAYQRAYVDFFEDSMAMTHAYDWTKIVDEYLFGGEQPLVHGLIGNLGHPLIHLGYAFEMDSREIGIEGLALAATQYSPLHKYLDERSYSRPAPFSAASPLELLARMADDSRFDALFAEPGIGNLEPLFEKHEALVLEYWNGWSVDDDPLARFQQSQDAAVAFLVASVPPGTHSYNFFVCHVLTTSHAVRVLLPHVPPRFHIGLVRQWWLLALAVYAAMLRPRIDPDYIGQASGQNWRYVDDRAVNGPWRTDSHFVKATRAIKEMAGTWGDVHERYLAAAIRFVDDFKGWTF